MLNMMERKEGEKMKEIEVDVVAVCGEPIILI